MDTVWMECDRDVADYFRGAVGGVLKRYHVVLRRHPGDYIILIGWWLSHLMSAGQLSVEEHCFFRCMQPFSIRQKKTVVRATAVHTCLRRTQAPRPTRRCAEGTMQQLVKMLHQHCMAAFSILKKDNFHTGKNDSSEGTRTTVRSPLWARHWLAHTP